MDRVLECLLSSESPVQTKTEVLRRCIKHLESEKSFDGYRNVLLVCLDHLYRDGAVEYHDPLKQICDFLIVRSPEELLTAVVDELPHIFEKTTELRDARLGKAVKHIHLVQETERLSHLLGKLDAESTCAESVVSVLRYLGQMRNPPTNPVVVNRLKEKCIVMISNEQFLSTIASADPVALITGLLHLLVLLSDADSKSDRDAFSDDIVDLSFRISKAILHTATQAERTDLIDLLRSMVEEFLVSTVTPETFHFPIASLLLSLNSITDETEQANMDMICSFINSVLDSRGSSNEHCFALLRRLTVWLIWQGNTNHVVQSLDKWIIGFYCELFRRHFYTSDVSGIHLPREWSEFILEQLRFVIHVAARQCAPDVATLNTLAFLLLAGTPSVSDPRQPLVMSDFVGYLNQLLSAYNNLPKTDQSECALNRLTLMVYMLVTSAYGTTSVLQTTTDEGSDTFRVFCDRVSTQLNSTTPTQATIVARLKVYQWSTLMRWRARAGINLQRCWVRWDVASSETHMSQSTSLVPNRQPTTSALTNAHPGLVNIGNTCYANAALQLLYHCPDFRVAVLSHALHASITPPNALQRPQRPVSAPGTENPLTIPVHANSSASPSTSSSPSSEKYVCRDKEEKTLRLDSSTGLLRQQLSTLFQALNTHKCPSARDTGAVLTLSKPAHFVNGEQQDAVEYLNHLLERLHEDELSGVRHTDSRRESPQSNLVNGHRSPQPLETDSVASTSNLLINGRPRQRTNSSPGVANVNASVKPSSSTSTAIEQTSLVRRMFGGQLVRHTSCTECAHISSTMSEDFSCLYLPVNSADDQLSDDLPFETETNIRKPNSETRPDLASLVRAHFTQIELVSTHQQCESCGKVTQRARRLSLRNLAPHVLICLNLFTFCRVKQTVSKVLHKIPIPERLSVTLSEASQSAQPNEPRGSDGSPRGASVTVRSYSLQGMILHHGLSISCGHYTFVARVGMQWILFDDDTAQYTTLEKIYSTPTTTPYLLLYKQV